MAAPVKGHRRASRSLCATARAPPSSCRSVSDGPRLSGTCTLTHATNPDELEERPMKKCVGLFAVATLVIGCHDSPTAFPTSLQALAGFIGVGPSYLSARLSATRFLERHIEY